MCVITTKEQTFADSFINIPNSKLDIINKVISEADAEGLDSFFLEVLSKPDVRTKKPEEEKEKENFLD